MLGTALLLILVGIVSLVVLRRRSRGIPGPWGLPLLGNALQLEVALHKPLCKWAERYGSFFRIRILSTEILVINDQATLREIFGEEAFAGRMDMTLMTPEGHTHGLLLTEGEDNKELRRFTLKTLRDFGFGKSLMEERIATEVEEFLEVLAASEGAPLTDIKEKVFLAIVNSIWATVAGKKNRQDDPQLKATVRKMAKMMEEIFKSSAVFLFVPWLAKAFPKWSGLAKVHAESKTGLKIFQDPVDEHKATFSADHLRDFIDVFLHEIHATHDPNSPFYGPLGNKHLVATLADLYFGGTDTTASTLTWMLLLLTNFPEVQRKLAAEIDAVVGSDRRVCLSDRVHMPYAEAVIAETLRFGTVSPQGISRRAMRDATFKGHLIKKDTLIMPNFYWIHFNPAVWGDPENFRPERFLSASGLFQRHDSFLAFSTGRRACIGETLARDNLFLFATNIFQRFSVRLDPQGPQNGLESTVTFVRVPLPFSVIVESRD